MTRQVRPAESSRRSSIDQRPHRVQDPRVRRSFGTALLVSALVAGAGLGVVALRVHHVQLTYRADQLRAERDRTDRLIRGLEVEVATLSAPGRLETRAQQLGLAAPTRAQVRLAREYVPSGAGSVAVRVTSDEALVR